MNPGAPGGAPATAAAPAGTETAVRSRSLAWRTLATCLGRTYLVGAAFNTRGMQNVGLAYAMEPGLAVIYPDPARLFEAKARYARHYNTHPFSPPMLVGIFLSMETKIARGLFPAKMMDGVKGTTIYTLSAIGDSLFGGSVMVLWSLTTIILLAAGWTGTAVALGVLCFLALQCFKAATFLMGFQEGLNVLRRFRRWNLINWGQRLKVVNGALLVVFWTQVWPGPILWWQWVAAGGVLGATAWAVNALGLTRELVGVVLLAGYLAWPLFLKLLAMVSP